MTIGGNTITEDKMTIGGNTITEDKMTTGDNMIIEGNTIITLDTEHRLLVNMAVELALALELQVDQADSMVLLPHHHQTRIGLVLEEEG